jgi:hypothetical protein
MSTRVAAVLVTCRLLAACGGDQVYAIPLTTPTGEDQGSFYMANMTIEHTTFALDLDTGSTITAIAGSGCSTCTGMSPLYTPGSSAMDTGMMGSETYADMSGWSGEIYADTVGLENGTPNVSLDFVDIMMQSMFFAGNDYQGILGMGPDALLDPGTTAYFDKVTAAGVAAKMAFELCPTDGTMWLGGYDASHAASSLQFTPILQTGSNADYYSVNMTAMGFGSADLGATEQTLLGPIVDTGTSLFYIPSAAQTTLIADINSDSAFQTLFPGQTLIDPTNSTAANAGCVMAASTTTDAMVDEMMAPLTMTFTDAISGNTITISAAPLASYFYDAGGGQYCMLVYGGGDQGNATMGDTILRAFITEIDIANKRVGFAPTSHCAAPEIAIDHHRLRERGHGPHHAR